MFTKLFNREKLFFKELKGELKNENNYFHKNIKSFERKYFKKDLKEI